MKGGSLVSHAGAAAHNRAEVAPPDSRENPRWEAGWGGGGRGGSVSRYRSSQQESEQGAMANALGRHRLTRTFDSGSCCVSLIRGDAGAPTGSCFLSPDHGGRKKDREELVTWSHVSSTSLKYPPSDRNIRRTNQ